MPPSVARLQVIRLSEAPSSIRFAMDPEQIVVYAGENLSVADILAVAHGVLSKQDLQALEDILVPRRISRQSLCAGPDRPGGLPGRLEPPLVLTIQSFNELKRRIDRLEQQISSS